MNYELTLQYLGDSALRVELGKSIDLRINRRVHALAEMLQQTRLPGVIEAVPAYASLVVYFDPLAADAAVVWNWVEDALDRVEEAPAGAGRMVEVPVRYGGEWGPDAEAVASSHSITVDNLIHLHSEAEYTVYMLGFQPGFPYLGGLNESIATPRLARPRQSVPAGSVGIAGAQTGIYPLESPGGWQIIGRTPRRLFDPNRQPPTLFNPGDRVRFMPVEDFTAPEALAVPAQAGTGGPAALNVLESGFMTAVQDLGRQGFERFGVPVSGAMDRFALMAANRLVGNAAGAAGLEFALQGPGLLALRDCLVAAAGGGFELRVDEKPLPLWMAVWVRRGQVLRLVNRPDVPGCWGCLAFGGGIDVPPVMGSRSTYLRGGFGGLEGRALAEGDELRLLLAAADATRLAGRSLGERYRPDYGSNAPLDVVLGPQAEAFSEQGLRTFLGEEYRVTLAADRMGYRLEGAPIEHCAPADVLSEGIPFGAVQVAADGQPMALLADRQTAGGYTKIATVAGASLPRLVQQRPGEGRVRFRSVSADEARRAWRELMQKLEDGLNEPEENYCG